MNEHDDNMRDIQQGESWLRAALPDDDWTAETESLRRQVEIEVNEKWLKANLPDDTPAGLDRNVRLAVSNALAEESPIATRRAGRAWRWLAPVAVAAALVFALFPDRTIHEQAMPAEMWFDLSASQDDVMDSLRDLETDLESLEVTVRDDSWIESNDLLDEMMLQIEELLDEGDLS